MIFEWLSPPPRKRAPADPFDVAEDVPSPVGGLSTLSGTPPGAVMRCVPLTEAPSGISIRRSCEPEPTVMSTLSRVKLWLVLPNSAPVSDQLVDSVIGVELPLVAASWKLVPPPVVMA